MSRNRGKISEIRGFSRHVRITLSFKFTQIVRNPHGEQALNMRESAASSSLIFQSLKTNGHH